MKRILGTVVAVLVCLGAGQAHAVSFEITGGELDLSGVQWGEVAFTPQWLLGDEPVGFELGAGERARFDFFTLALDGLGMGQLTSSIQFAQPVPATVVHTTETWSLSLNGTLKAVVYPEIGAGAVKIDWAEPVQTVTYGNGGLFSVALDPIFVDGPASTSVTISGTVENTYLPNPEPTTMLLLGTGLLGISWRGRKVGRVER